MLGTMSRAMRLESMDIIRKDPMYAKHLTPS